MGALGLGPKVPGAAVQHCRTWNSFLSPRKQLVDPAVPRTLVFVAQDSWSTLLALGHKPESPRRAGRPPGHSDTITRRPGQLVDPAESQSLTRVTRENSSILWALGEGHESPGTVVIYCGPTGTGPILPGQLVDTAGLRTQTRVTRDRCSTPGASDLGPSRPGILVATPGPCSLSQVSWERWSTTRNLGPGPRSPVTAGRPRGNWHKDLRVSHPGQVLDHAKPRARPRIIWDSCSNPCLGPECETPRTAG